MNINMDELGAKMTTHEVDIVLSCEEYSDCEECEYYNNFVFCHNCPDNKSLKSAFKQKQSELDKLFIGAPVIVDAGGIDRLYKFDKKIKYSMRLPTIEESPRNVWLAPHLEMPDDFFRLNCLIRYNINDIEHKLLNNTGPFKWCDVESFMILEDFKK